MTLAMTLPGEEEMWRAVLERDSEYDGVFFTAVRSTGIFCRPTCPARKPHRENVSFYRTTSEALFAGYRPCKRCRPLEHSGQAPTWVREAISVIEEDPARRWRDRDLRDRGLDPVRLRRWFKAHHGMTFQAYQRARRLARALGQLSMGDEITRTAYRNGFESLSGFNEAIRRLTGSSPGEVRNRRLVHVTRIPTLLGTMVAGATPDAVCLLEFADRPMLETQLERVTRHLNAVLVPGESAATRQAAVELDEYFAGERTSFSVPLDLEGTAFQRRVWDELRSIPFGATRTYSEQARRIGQPQGVRAVARANGDNRIAIIVPCHRVVGSDGSLTGYGGGLWRKRRLLELEQGVADER